MSAVDLQLLASWISDIHNKHRDGCKGSCGEREIGYHHSDHYDSYWFARFGGYCLGTLSRHVEIQSQTLGELTDKVKSTINKAILAESTAWLEELKETDRISDFNINDDGSISVKLKQSIEYILVDVSLDDLKGV